MPCSRRTALSALAGGLASAQTRRTPPNVIVFVLDDLGCKDLGYLGAPGLQTPQIDALARGGAIMEQWYSNAPVCAPARASILSGRYPARAGVATNGSELTPGIPTIANTLRAGGYRTAAIGKWHLGSRNQTDPNAHGFDRFYGFHSGCVDFYSHRYYWGEPRRVNYHDLWRDRTEIFEDGQYLTHRITEETVAFIDQNRSRPFFVYAAYNAPHYPMHAPAAYLDRFPTLPPERRIYAAMIAAVDDGIGQIRRTLERTGLFDNTLILFVGDNGATTEKRAGLHEQYATAGDNGIFKGFKFSLFDGGVHVPAFASWPERIRPGTRITHPLLSMDLLPTIADAAGLRTPEGVDGRSALRVITDGAPSPHDYLFWDQGGQQAVRKGRWKLVLNGRLYDRRPDGGRPLTGEDAVWLSDLSEDPGETKNLRHLHPGIVDELSTAAGRWASR